MALFVQKHAQLGALFHNGPTAGSLTHTAQQISRSTKRHALRVHTGRNPHSRFKPGHSAEDLSEIECKAAPCRADPTASCVPTTSRLPSMCLRLASRTSISGSRISHLPATRVAWRGGCSGRFRRHRHEPGCSAAPYPPACCPSIGRRQQRRGWLPRRRRPC